MGPPATRDDVPDVVLELCGDAVLDVPAEQRRVGVKALLLQGGVGRAIIGKARQPELHKHCIVKDALPFVAGEHFALSFDGKAFYVQSLTAKPMWVEEAPKPQGQPLHSSSRLPLKEGPLSQTEIAEDDEPVELPIDGHVVLSTGLPGCAAKRLRWRLLAADVQRPQTKAASSAELQRAVDPVKILPKPTAVATQDEDIENHVCGNAPRLEERCPLKPPESDKLPMPGKYCFYCNRGLPADDGRQMGGRWYCNLDHHLLWLGHGRPTPSRSQAVAPQHPVTTDISLPSAAAAGAMAAAGKRRCSQPMTGTLGERRPGGSVAAVGSSGPGPSKKLQATPEQLLTKERWFAPRGVTVTLTSGGAVKCRVVARRTWMLKTLLDHVGAKLGVATSELSLHAVASDEPALKLGDLLGDIIPLEDFACSFELQWRQTQIMQELPTQAEFADDFGRTSAASSAPTRAGDAVDITVRGLDTSLNLFCARSWQVAHLKTEIAKCSKVAPWEMKLYVGEEALDDSESIDLRFPHPVGEVTLVKFSQCCATVTADEEVRLFEVVAPHFPTSLEGFELELRLGERICVVEQDASGWWGGYRLPNGRDKLGWFPGNCVRRLQYLY